MNQGARTFALVGLIVIILLAVHLLPTLSVGNVELRHVNVLSDVLPEVYRQRDAIDVIPKPEPPKAILAARSATTQEAVKQISPKGVTMIDDYSEGEAGGMDHFYSMLAQIKTLDRPVRIAYYGDSFIEGDILTCDIRERLQRKFGGNGVGWVDCGSEINGFRRTVAQKFSGMTEYEVVKKPFNHKNEGINQRYFVPSENATVQTAGTQYRKLSAKWQVARLYFRTATPFTIHTSIGGADVNTFNAGGSPAVQQAEIKQPMSNITYRFNNIGADTYLYGMSLESEQGIVLDNFSMRGSAGNTLSYIPQTTLSDFARLRPYDLIILHYGLNVVNEKSHAANYKAYVKKMKRAVDAMRKAYPEASILVVSVPDRDQRTAGGIRTMLGVEALSAYQQIMASDCRVAYFNLFKAMGGRESMARMVDKRWANKDYTHLSFAGGAHVANYFYRSLMAGLDNYQLRTDE